MAFQLHLSSGASSPVPRDPHPAPGNEDSFVSALHAAFSFASPSHDTDPAMGPSKPHISLDILPASYALALKGTGVDVEPAVLAGHVALYLTEPTSIKEITLQFRGKARVPLNPSDPIVLNAAPTTYVVCQHDWSFLEGKKKHSHTLKPGRHLFPFELRLGGSLPSSIATHANGGAFVSYKLRATATRPGLSANLTAVCPVTLTRTLAAEALEYQQTLEVENTWPEKVMYSIVLPHKAWAAGDDLTTLLKLVPLTKGVRVLSVVTRINETTKTYSRGGHIENMKVVVTKKHVIVDGRAVYVEEHPGHPLGHFLRNRQHSSSPTSPHGHSRLGSTDSGLFTSSPDLPGTAGSSSESPLSSAESSSEQLPSNDVSTASADHPDPEPGEVVTRIVVPLPTALVPSHALDPIVVSYRIRWSILIANPDGHASELRCSLPIHILHHSLIDEARSATRMTRQLLLGGDDAAAAAADDMELPSYPAHVRDRVANVFLPESATVRVTNPWVHNHVDPVLGHAASGAATPLEAHYVAAGTSDAPGTPLEWVNSELLLSLSDTAPPRPTHAGTLPARAATPDSPAGSDSRRASRAGSPERGGAGATHVHAHAHALAGRPAHGLFHMTLKPLSGLPHAWAHGGARAAAAAASASASAGSTPPASPALSAPPTPAGVDAASGAALLHRAFTAVPTYAVALRGFLGGGVPPLDSVRGLPSYEEARAGAQDAARE